MRVSLEEYEKALGLAKEAILKDGFIVFPTDTLYGLGANALSEVAVSKLFEAKRREGKPISIMVANLEMLKKYCHIDEKQEKILVELLPGPYTVILKKKYKFPEKLAPGESIGVRIPEHFFCITLVKQLGLPITATSANLSGQNAAFRLNDVSGEIYEKADVLVDGGKCKYAAGSTIMDLIGEKPRIMREGAGLEKANAILADV